MNANEATFEDLLNQSEVKDLLYRAEREMFPAMKGSAVSLVIAPEKPDAKLALEIGAAILFDKPLLIVVPRGRSVPARLRRIADAVVEIEFGTDAGQQELTRALEDMLGRGRRT